MRYARRNGGFVSIEDLLALVVAGIISALLIPYGIQLRVDGSTFAGTALLVAAGLVLAFGFAVAGLVWHSRAGWPGVICMLGILIVTGVVLLGSIALIKIWIPG